MLSAVTKLLCLSKMQEKIPDYSEDLFDSSESSVEDNGPSTTNARKFEHTWARETLRKRQTSHVSLKFDA